MDVSSLLAIAACIVAFKVFATNVLFFAVVLIGLFCVAVSKLTLMVYRQLTFWKKRSVPCVKCLPIIGCNFNVILRRRGFSELCNDFYNAYPDVKYIGLMDFFTPTVFLRDPEIIREIALKSFEYFPDHRPFITEDMDPIFGKNVFSLRGERWKEMRHALTPSFTASKMRFMFELVSKCSREFVEYFKDHPEVAKCWEAKEIFSKYTNDVIASVAFGLKVNSLKEKDNEFYKNGRDLTNFIGISKLVKFLLFRFAPRLMRFFGVNFLKKSTTNFFKNIITETVQVREEKKIERPDMIQLLMQARDKESDYETTIEDIIAQSFIFFLAGFDTTSTSLSFLAYELAVNPDVQEKLREEVDRVLAEENGTFTYEALSTMPYMDMVISENLRKNPALVVIDRVCVKNFEIPPCIPGQDSVLLEPDTQVWFPLYALHHDPRFFPDPEKFDPERFSEENKDKIIPCSYIPFGIGPRKCIGNRFALMEVKIVIAHLLQHFVLKLSEKTSLPITLDKKVFTPQVEGGVWIVLESRKSSSVTSFEG